MNWVDPSSPSGNIKVKKVASISKTEKNKKIDLSPNSKTILERRYLRKKPDGTPVETIEGLFERVARVVSEPDTPYRDVQATEIEFYNLLTTKRMFPNSPTFTGAGTPLGQLAACFVLPISDDLGKQYDGIFATLKAAALIQQRGGGNGFSFSRLRPRGDLIKSSNGKATGPVGFMSVYDAAFEEIAQGGIRRGANMGVLRVDHPDIREFIVCKTDEGKISNFNISVAITDKFMKAVRNDETYDLVNPSSGEVVETPKAREIFEMIVNNAYINGEPGVLFIDEANRANPVPHLYELEATNPCGEQWLGPYENCSLASVNLAQHIDEGGNLDWGALAETTALTTRFLDNVVSANKYVPEVPELREAALDARRIGLGFMGLADAMYSMGIRYGSEKGQEFAAQIMEFIRFHSMKTSIELAEERGSFLKIKGSIYDPNNMVWTPPEPLWQYQDDFGRPKIDWQEVVDGIKQHGIRNAAQTTIAPTGTASTSAGVEGYGCEPVFALAYLRNVFQSAGDGEDLTLTYVSPLFEQALDTLDLGESEREKIIEEAVQTGSCQVIEELPKHVRDVFVVSADVTAEEHIKMQASVQAFVDNSISKTCNFPESATKDDVAKAYMLGWELGCKGLTVYVTGSRDEVVLETKETREKKGGVEVPVKPHITKRSYKLSGSTYKMKTPQGNAYITINKDQNNDPFEVFLSVGKAGSDVQALSEALGRAISGWFRASYEPLSTVKEITEQLIGIGGARSIGFGNNRVSSIPDAVAKVLSQEFNVDVRLNSNADNESGDDVDDVTDTKAPEKVTETSLSTFSQVDMCPDCGNWAYVKQEGCSKCYECGFSEC